MFGEKAKEAQIIINGVDIRKYTYTKEREEKMRKELGLGDEPVVGHVGRLSKEKNHSFLFRIFKEIQKKESSVVLLLCGGGDEAQKKQLEEEAEALGNPRLCSFSWGQKRCARCTSCDECICISVAV